MTKIIKLVEERQLCSLPWVHTEVTLQDDSIKPCCKYTASFGKISDGFKNVWHNDHAKALRQDWMAGVNVAACSACDVDEQSFSYKKWKNNLC